MKVWSMEKLLRMSWAKKEGPGLSHFQIEIGPTLGSYLNGMKTDGLKYYASGNRKLLSLIRT
jgi:hypothetical protein